MDSRLFWSAPAKRRGRIESQRRGIPAAFVGNLGTGFHARRGDGAFPWPQRLGCEQCVAESKAAAGKSPRANPVVTSGAADSGRYRGKVAAALQNVRCCPSRVVNGLESIKSQSISCLPSCLFVVLVLRAHRDKPIFPILNAAQAGAGILRGRIRRPRSHHATSYGLK